MRTLFLSLCAIAAWGQAWTGQLPATRAIDWTSAGATITSRPSSSTCAHITAGATLATINAAIVTCNGSSKVLLIDPGTYGPYNGALDFSQCSNGCSNFTLRGSGPTQTIIKFSGGGNCLVPGTVHVCFYSGNSLYNTMSTADTANLGNAVNGANECAWFGGYAQGTTQIAINQCGNNVPAAGELLVLDQLDNAHDHGTDATPHYMYACQDYAKGCASDNQGGTAPCVTVTGGVTQYPLGSGGQGRACRGQAQIVKISSIASSTTGLCTGSGTTCYLVTITPGLYDTNWNLGSSYTSNPETRSPGAWRLGIPIQGVGIENLTLDNGGDTTYESAVSFVNAYNCWMKNVRQITYGSSTMGRNFVWLYQVAHITVQDSYFTGVQSLASQSYAVEGYLASDWLVQNNIFTRTAIPTIFDLSEGCVVAYNYTRDEPYISKTWGQANNYAHAEGDDYCLFEGNDGFGYIGDQIHGTHHLNTLFRNVYSGWQEGKTQETAAIHLQTHTRMFNIIGNVLGTHTFHDRTAPNGNYLDCAGSAPCLGTPDGLGDVSVLLEGWCGNEGQDTSTFACITANGMADDPLVYKTTMHWGNWDVNNAAVRFVAGENPSGIGDGFATNANPSQTLPNSYYLCGTVCTAANAGRPNTWWETAFGTPAFPPIGPDVNSGNLTDAGGGTLGGHANKIPARLCYENTALDNTESGAVSNVSSITSTGSNPVVSVTVNATQSLTWGDVFRVSGVTGNAASVLNGDHLLYASCPNGDPPTCSGGDPLSGSSVIFAALNTLGTFNASAATITRNPVLNFDAANCYTGIAANPGVSQRAIAQ